MNSTTTEPIETLTTPPLVGHAYLVPCVRSLQSERLIAVLGPPHRDPDLAADFDHVHPDLRFWTDMEIRMSVLLHPQFAPKAMLMPGQDMSRILAANLVFARDKIRHAGHHALVCQRDAPEPLVPRLPTFVEFEARYAGTVLAEGRCPHRGTPLLSQPLRDGRRICPSHGLCFTAEGRQCPRKS